MPHLESKGLHLDGALSQTGSVALGKSFIPSESLFFEYKTKEKDQLVSQVSCSSDILRPVRMQAASSASTHLRE